MKKIAEQPYPPISPGRSRIMSAIKSKGNLSTEIKFARVLRRNRISGWRRHPDLPGRPDFYWQTARVVVFVDGCFWHGCPNCYKAPSYNKKFWSEKVATNRQRDRRVAAKLRRMGWAVFRIWECRIEDAATRLRIKRAVAIKEYSS